MRKMIFCPLSLSAFQCLPPSFCTFLPLNPSKAPFGSSRLFLQILRSPDLWLVSDSGSLWQISKSTTFLFAAQANPFQLVCSWKSSQPIWFEAEYIAQETGMNGLPASENGFSQRSNQSTETVSIAQETGMNGLPSSANGFSQRSNQSTETKNNTDANSYRKRLILSTIEDEQLEAMERDPLLQMFKGLSMIFEGPLNQIKEWPFRFEKKEAAGRAMQNGFLNLWSTFIIAETLLAGVAIQPFVTNAPNISGWQLEVYGGLWALALLLDSLGLAITALLLGFLLGKPSHLAWV
jgi:hypothetical protein